MMNLDWGTMPESRQVWRVETGNIAGCAACEPTAYVPADNMRIDAGCLVLFNGDIFTPEIVGVIAAGQWCMCAPDGTVGEKLLEAAAL